MPNCRAYDPCFAGEFAVILDHGMRADAASSRRDVFYYVTLMNENYAQPSLPAGVEADVIKGLYRWIDAARGERPRRAVRLLGSGAILREVIAAAELLRSDWRRRRRGLERHQLQRAGARRARGGALQPPASRPNRAHQPRRSAACRATRRWWPRRDYVRAWPQLIAPHVEAPFIVLGTDGFGRSDTRAALRRFFEVDRHHVVLAALNALARAGTHRALDVRRGDPALWHRDGSRRVVELLIGLSRTLTS